jgi:ribosomal protein S27AE
VSSAVAEIRGHPAEPLLDEVGNLIQMITVCAHCGNARTILFLSKDRWFCFRCRAEGVTPPNLYPIA